MYIIVLGDTGPMSSPMTLKYESTFDMDIVNGLGDLGHDVVDNGGAGSVVGARVKYFMEIRD